MKLKFKHQHYQAQAVAAVADCFKGQPPSSNFSYQIDPGKQAQTSTVAQMSLPFDETGFRNDEISKSIKLLENINSV